MAKIKSVEELSKLRLDLQNQRQATKDVVQIRIAMATCGLASGAKAVYDFMTAELAKRNIEAVVISTGCLGYCYAEPTVEVTVKGKEPVVFGYVDTKKADVIIEKYIKNGILVEDVIPLNYQTI